MIFECVLQLSAELTKFADREFYRDWWNSTSYSDYIKKVNRPVDDFGRRYVRQPLIKKFHFSQTVADFFLSLFSVLC